MGLRKSTEHQKQIEGIEGIEIGEETEVGQNAGPQDLRTSGPQDLTHFAQQLHTNPLHASQSPQRSMHLKPLIALV